MIFIGLMSALGALSYLIQLLFGNRRDWRMPLRHGMGAAFVYTGLDHFIHAETRYQPMIPDYLAPYDFGFVAISGVLELLGGLALLMPLWGWRTLRLPNLRPVAGVCLVMLLSVMVIENGEFVHDSPRDGIDEAKVSKFLSV